MIDKLAKKNSIIGRGRQSEIKIDEAGEQAGIQVNNSPSNALIKPRHKRGLFF